MANSAEEIEQAKQAGKTLAEALQNGLKDSNGRVRAEDLITAAASIVGERCLFAAGDFNPLEHSFIPGSAVFSDNVNQLLTGDTAIDSWEQYPITSVCGLIWAVLTKQNYLAEDFCDMKQVFELFAANIGKQENWGKVPLSVPTDNLPMIMPLRINFEARDLVDQVFQELRDDQSKLTASVYCLIAILIWVAQVIDKKVAIKLALETVNGMSKTAPMTKAALAKVAEEGKKS